MKQISENCFDVKDILRKQLALLAEKSKECEPMELCQLTTAMIEIAKALF